MSRRVDEIRAKLHSLNHIEVIEDYPAGDTSQLGGLAGYSAPGFRFLNKSALEAMLKALSGRPQGPGAGQRLALRGRILWLLGQTAAARQDLERALELRPNDTESLCYLGITWIHQRDQLALSYLDKAVKTDRRAPWPYLWRAAAKLERAGQAGAALRDLETFEGLSADKRFCPTLMTAMALIEGGFWKRAIDQASGLIAMAPDSATGYTVRFQARLLSGDTQGAASDYHQARNRDPDHAGFHMIVSGPRHALPRHMTQRLKFFEAAVKRYPDLPILRAERAEALRERGVNRFDLALDEYRKLEPSLGEFAWFQAHFARAQASATGWRACLRRLDRAVSLFPAGGWIYAWRGEAKRHLGREREALCDLNRAIAKAPWYGYQHVWRGMLHAGLGRWRRSLADLDAAIGLGLTYPANGRGYSLRSQVKWKLGDTLGAVDDLSRAFLLDSKYTWITSRDKSLAAGQCRRALHLLNAAIKAAPRHAWARAWRGHLWLEQGQLARARRDLDLALAADPSLGWALTWRALVSQRLGHPDAAMADLKRALKRAPGLWLAATLLADEHCRRARPGTALKIILEAQKANPTAAAFFAKKAEVLRALSKPRQSLEAAEIALQLDGHYAEGHVLKACALLDLGKDREGLEQAEAAIKLKDTLPLAYLARSAARGRLGDAQGQVDDFKLAYGCDPALFKAALRP